MLVLAIVLFMYPLLTSKNCYREKKFFFLNVLKLIFSDIFYYFSSQLYHNNIRIVRLSTCREAHLYRIPLLCDLSLLG